MPVNLRTAEGKEQYEWQYGPTGYIWRMKALHANWYGIILTGVVLSLVLLGVATNVSILRIVPLGFLLPIYIYMFGYGAYCKKREYKALSESLSMKIGGRGNIPPPHTLAILHRRDYLDWCTRYEIPVDPFMPPGSKPHE